MTSYRGKIFLILAGLLLASCVALIWKTSQLPNEMDFQVTVFIPSPPTAVWARLNDFSDWPNTFSMLKKDGVEQLQSGDLRLHLKHGFDLQVEKIINTDGEEETLTITGSSAARDTSIKFKLTAIKDLITKEAGTNIQFYQHIVLDSLTSRFVYHYIFGSETLKKDLEHIGKRRHP